MDYLFTLEGAIMPKARARITSKDNYHNLSYSLWMKLITAELIAQKLIKNYYQELVPPLSLKITLINPQKQGDINNIAGSIMDALVKAGIIKNDNLTNIDYLLIEAKKDPSKQKKAIITLSENEKY